MKISRYADAFRTTLCSLALAVAVQVPAPAQASAIVSDQGAFWFNSSNLGWGVQLAPQGAAIFATLYVYDDDNRPFWYVATLDPRATGLWAGDLYAIGGPWLGPLPTTLAGLGLRNVGTMTWQAASGNAAKGALTYVVDGVPTTEAIARQAGSIIDDYSGRYAVARSWSNTCKGESEDVVELAIAQSPPLITFEWSNMSAGVDCKFSGNLVQEREFGRVSGTYSCGDASGPLRFYEMKQTAEALTARWTADEGGPGCRTEGSLTGARRR